MNRAPTVGQIIRAVKGTSIRVWADTSQRRRGERAMGIVSLNPPYEESDM
jgi:hypothetical protein